MKVVQIPAMLVPAVQNYDFNYNFENAGGVW